MPDALRRLLQRRGGSFGSWMIIKASHRQSDRMSVIGGALDDGDR